MEYVTINELNEFRLVMINLWLVLTSITYLWCLSSIIIELAKIYAFKSDIKEIFRSLFNILKTLVYMIPMGMMTLISNELYNNNLNLELICKITLIAIAIISISISVIYRAYNKKLINNLNVDTNEDTEKENNKTN